jgi:predicted O-linked N-acetylglucosamine transferase (SPINDLY family)
MPDGLAAIHEALRREAWSEARTGCAAALVARPDDARLHHALGMACCGDGQFAAAVAPFARALALDPGSPSRSRTAAIVYAQLERWDDVVRVLAPVLARLDTGARALFLKAGVESGAAAAAVAVFDAASPSLPEGDGAVRYERGRALHAAGRLAEAEAAFEACLATEPPLVQAHDAMATLLQVTDRGDQALAHAEAYSRLAPASGFAQLRLAVALSLRGRLAEAREARLAARRLGLRGGRAWTTALKHMLCDTDEDGASIAEAAAEAIAATVPGPPRPTAPRPPRAGRLRVGYLSAELDVPPASHFLNPFLRAHDRSRVEVFLYDTRPAPPPRALDAVARLGEHTRAVGRLHDDALLAVVDADAIDVLVDLGTHFPHNRLSLLARRAAPVQASLPNCPATTGCREVDYLLSDRWTSPAGTDPEYVESLHRLEAGYLVYAPPRVCAPWRPSPASRNGFVTFGLIQQLMKIGADVWDAVTAVLAATPDARLLLHNPDGELSRPESATCAFLRRQLAERGVDPARMRIVGERPHVEHLALLSEIDVALDTWPFSGTTTTCECLWMGVPVVTRAGRTHASRVSAGLLRRAGLDRFVATDPAGYVALATALAADRNALRAYRGSLRQRIIAAGLTDGRALASELERVYAGWVAARSTPPAARRARGGSAGR